MRASNAVIMYVKAAVMLTIVIVIIVSCSTVSAFAHSTLLVATACQKTATTYEVSGTAISWKADSTGANSNVIIEQSTVHANNSVTSGYVTTGAFNAANGYQFSFTFTVPSTAVTVTVRSTAGTWVDGANGGQVNTAYASFVGACPPPPTPKVTPEPPTATATATKTATPTATVTVTPTPTTTWDKSSIEVTVKCLAGYTVFIVTNTGASMTDGVEWKLYLNENIIQTGKFKLAAGENTFKQYTPGSYDGTLTLVVNQRPGHPGTGSAQASINNADCIIAPTVDYESMEPAQNITVTLDTIDVGIDGQTWSWYLVECKNISPYAIVELQATKDEGNSHTVITLMGTYCNSKVGVRGTVQSMVVIGIVADSESVGMVYLPLVTK